MPTGPELEVILAAEKAAQMHIKAKTLTKADFGDDDEAYYRFVNRVSESLDRLATAVAQYKVSKN